MIVVRRLVFLSLVFVVLAGTIAVVAAAPKAGGVLKVALLRDPTGWDPHINYGATTYSFLNNVYEQLVRYSAKGALEPGLAVRWETPDPRTYVLHLRKNVRFHSGNPWSSLSRWSIRTRCGSRSSSRARRSSTCSRRARR
jgi:peptide/nickel transport system substrate-binding protein